jgi:hypothetical protein
MKDNPFYTEKHTGFLLKQGEEFEPAVIYQPTPEGVAELCAHYSEKYSIDLKCIDLRLKVDVGDNAFLFFKYLQSNPSLMNIEEGCVRGLILSYSQYHVIPVLLTKIDGIQSMVLFDSTSGPRTKGYFRIANLFPEFQVYLNSGTRQADEGSCMTDAICVLKEALMVPDLMALIQSKEVIDSPDLEPARFFVSLPKPEHFHLFKMPERLLLTAQRSQYLVQAGADVNIIIRGGKSLKSYRDDFVLNVMKDGEWSCINGYLYLKAKEHRCILDARMQAYSLSASSDEVDGLSISVSPWVTARKEHFEEVGDTPYGSPYGFSPR